MFNNGLLTTIKISLNNKWLNTLFLLPILFFRNCDMNDHSYLSLVAMNAPSPDWYAGIVDLNLFNNGCYLSDTTLAAFLYDAGTEPGITFASDNEEAVPQQPIQSISALP